MKRKEFLKHLEDNQANDLKILEKKNQDYSHGEDPFQNFRMVEQLGLITTEEGIMTRMSDKMQRTANLLQRETRAVKDEDIKDALSDLRNYANILEVYLTHEKEASQ